MLTVGCKRAQIEGLSGPLCMHTCVSLFVADVADSFHSLKSKVGTLSYWPAGSDAGYTPMPELLAAKYHAHRRMQAETNRTMAAVPLLQHPTDPGGFLKQSQ